MPGMPEIPSLTTSIRVIVQASARATVRLEAARFRFRETGGALFGYVTASRDIVVTDATAPGPNAHHGFLSFEPDTAYCQRCLNSVYEMSRGKVSYVGEWHTHPHSKTVPSDTDWRAMYRIATDPDQRQPQPLLWIHRAPDRVGSLAWQEEDGLYLVDASGCEWIKGEAEWNISAPST
jgi:integrative and conjugative element protein (TIGR02256 family)